MPDESIAARFFREREIVVPSVGALFGALRRRRTLRGVAAGWIDRQGLPGRPNDDFHWFYRGQTDASWGLSSSLYRVAREKGVVTEIALERTEARIIEAMRAQGLGHHMTDGQLLMVLQHHGVPTRLIDVSEDEWLPAMWFATEHSDTADGRLFIIGLRKGANGGQSDIPLAETQSLPWKGAAIGAKYSTRLWSQTIGWVKEEPLDPRMVAQRGRFLVGGLAKRYAGENWPVDGQNVPADVWPDISALRIFFPQRGATKTAGARWGAVGWTLRIPGEMKPEIRRELAKHDYTPDHMYPDFDGSRRLGQFVARGM